VFFAIKIISGNRKVRKKRTQRVPEKEGLQTGNLSVALVLQVVYSKVERYSPLCYLFLLPILPA